MSGILAGGRSVRFRAGGASMQPFLRDGDILLIAPLSRPLRAGDVAAFTVPPVGELLIHRLIGARKGELRFKGDGVCFLDPPVRRENVLGLVRAVERNGREVRFANRLGRKPAALASRFGLLSAVLAVRWRLRKIIASSRADV